MRNLDHLRESIERFLREPGKELGRWARFAQFQLQLWRFCARQLWQNNVTAMSSALSFRTIFAMVPLLVLAFLILKSVGGLDTSKESLRRLLDETGFSQITMAPPGQTGDADPEPASEAAQAKTINLGEEIEKLVERVESKLTVGRLGPIGAVLLIWTALTLLTAMERSLNRIFGAQRSRSLIRRMPFYWSMMTLTPLVLSAAVYLGTRALGAVDRATGLAWLLTTVGWGGPFLVGVLVVAALYKLLPNTHVRSRAALGGAIVAVPLWLIAKWGFDLYVRRYVATGNLYGALGLLPLFLIWLNVSWLIFLFGAQLAHAAANLDAWQSTERARRIILGPADMLAAAVVVARSYLAGGPARMDEITARLRLPVESAEWLLERLEALGVVCAVEGSAGGYVPARSADRISVLEALHLSEPDGQNGPPRYEPDIAAPVARIQEQARAALGSLTLADLAPTGRNPGGQ